MKEEKEVLGEEVIEEEEVEEEKPKKKRGSEYELVLNIEDLAVKEALSDVLAVNEEIPKGPPSRARSYASSSTSRRSAIRLWSSSSRTSPRTRRT